MLAVFEKSVAKCPEALQSPHSGGASSALKDGCLANHFGSIHPGSVTVNFGSSGLLSYSPHKQNPLLPRLFAVVDDIFCLFQGHIQNVAVLKQQYGLNKTANEVVRDFEGKYSFVLYDSTAKAAFIAADVDGSVPFYWGSDSESHLVVSDDDEILKQACGKSFAPFPKGCFFTTSGGLRSYEHPLNELKPVPRVDSSGQMCGANFKVDSETKKEGGMPRVGSAYDWSKQY
ncbi:aluminum induced protein with YGL and LRDR motifs [Euphorbia peplus]|nr:aluminum induced protein with YGL and LRDR motifs [Euphorbia peplus]